MTLERPDRAASTDDATTLLARLPPPPRRIELRREADVSIAQAVAYVGCTRAEFLRLECGSTNVPAARVNRYYALLRLCLALAQLAAPGTITSPYPRVGVDPHDIQ